MIVALKIKPFLLFFLSPLPAWAPLEREKSVELPSLN